MQLKISIENLSFFVVRTHDITMVWDRFWLVREYCVGVIVRYFSFYPTIFTDIG